jgi:hypothetical protein
MPQSMRVTVRASKLLPAAVGKTTSETEPEIGADVAFGTLCGHCNCQILAVSPFGGQNE